MKNLLIIFALLISVSANAGDLEKYKNAYKVIKDSSIVEKCFSAYYTSRTDTYQICLSDRIYYMSKIFFITNIIEYEYGNPKPYGTFWRQIRDTLTNQEFEIENKHGSLNNYKELPDLNRICNPDICDLKLFFGDIDEKNRLCAYLVYNNGHENFKNAFNQSQCGLHYLIYFEGDNVSKIIILEFVR